MYIISHRTDGIVRSLRKNWLLPIFCLAALAQTMLYYAYLRDDPGNYNSPGAFGDQVSYLKLAHQLLTGSWEGLAHYMPGYPAVLALGQVVFGDPRFGVAVVQGLIYVALVLGAARLASAAFGSRARLWAAGLLALNPALGYHAGQALTEFLTAALVFAAAALVFVWSRQRKPGWLVLLGLACAAMVYLRSEYLALAGGFALVVFVTAREDLRLRLAAVHAGLVLFVVTVLIAPWVARNAAITERLGLYNASPASNLVLMSTWFRVFDEQAFARLQEIQQAPIGDDEAVRRASKVGPRPELSARYIAQVRGPYELPLHQALRLALENISLNPQQYVVNHFMLAPVLIWAGRTPVRQADLAAVPRLARWGMWAVQFGLVILAIWQAVISLRSERARILGLSALGVLAFLTAVHVLIAVEARFTAPALPLVMLLAGACLAKSTGPACRSFTRRVPRRLKERFAVQT